ncbi:MAG: glutamine synthetase III [Clostridia bacterium]|nr:glutamine synthetase III [Clostridia bacterium]
MTNIPEIFASMVFNDDVMRKSLPQDVYESLHRTIESGSDLDITVATAVASAMKEWAISKGATHFTHWFQPMTGITAEKHDSFISPTENGHVLMEFSGKELIKGESDASSFPSGGLRATFEARGYTAWDPTSYAFIKDNTLCIPTVFCSYGGASLDKKTPLLRSSQAVSREALRVLKLFGNEDVKKVTPTVGAEQEYFLIDKQYYIRRRDLMYCGRTLFGAPPPKGQQLDDHYYGAIKPRITAFMKELDEELWKLGVLAKTEHNEVAPAQHELAPIFTNLNTAADHNQLMMEIMKKVADRHGLVCLLHEKPFAGVNGSGKHNNWSLSTDTGANLLDPGKSPRENAQFLLFLAAIIKAVDEHQDLLRLSVASAGNDHRLGANEAPPSIISCFIGEDLEKVVAAIVNRTSLKNGDREHMEIGVHGLPTFPKDATDRNRTSPFAFTGNKFEFRSLGAPASIAGPNIILNTIVADELSAFADTLEKAKDFEATLNDLIRTTFKEHRRIIFNGDGYSERWVAEAKARGLLNLRTTVDAIPYYRTEENIALFERHGVFTREEILSRTEILLETYSKVIAIEARTMAEMGRQEILPTVIRFTERLANAVNAKKKANPALSCKAENIVLEDVSERLDEFYDRLATLERATADVPKDCYDSLRVASAYKDTVVPAMASLRKVADELEARVDSSLWPYPTYGELLFNI